MANMASTTLIEEPLVIGAGDLLRGVKYTHCGVLYVQNDSHFGKKWKQRYVIISEGCLYIYPDRKSKKSEHAYSFKQFDSAIDCDPINGETVCFCLRYKNGHGSILFSCDTRETGENWLDKFWSVISEVETTFNKLSLDSGFGSAGTVPRNKIDMSTNEERADYDEVKVGKFEETNNFPVQACDDDDAYEIPIASGRSYSTRTDSLYENVKYKHKDDIRPGATRNVQKSYKSDAVMNELKASKGIKASLNEERAGYDEVKVVKFEKTNHFPVQACDDDDAYEIPIASGRPYSTRTNILYENVKYKHKDDIRHGAAKSVQRNEKSDAVMDELKASKALSKRTEHLSAKERSEAHEEAKHCPSSLLARSLPSSVASTFMSVRGNIEPADKEQSMSYLSVHGQDNVYANGGHLNNSVYSDDTCLKSRYTQKHSTTLTIFATKRTK